MTNLQINIYTFLMSKKDYFSLIKEPIIVIPQNIDIIYRQKKIKQKLSFIFN